MPELTITASLWAVDDVTVIPACISNPSLGGRNKYTYDISIEMADSDYAPYNEPWWGTFNWAPNMTPDGVGGLSLGIAGEERFSIMPGETHNIIGVDVYLESIKTGDLPNALNSAQFKASAYLPVRRVTTQDTHNEAALPDCSTPPETGGYGA